MFVNPFVLGILATLFAEMALLIVLSWFSSKKQEQKMNNKIIRDINELSVFEIEQLAKVLRIEFIINNGNEIEIIRKEK